VDEGSERTGKRVVGIRVPNLVAYAVIGLGVGLLTGILLAREHGRQVGGHRKDGGHLMQVEAHRYSRTSLPAGAAIGTVAGAGLGFLVGLLTKIGKRANRVPLTPDVENAARAHFAPVRRQEDADAIRTADEGVQEDERGREC
jgi:hypothetical protein